MKKILLTVAALATTMLTVQAQRLTLHEEFTGENCGPCAATNPSFWSLCDGSGNPANLIHITYMEPIPSSGWYYMRTQALSDARANYYAIPFAPDGRYDGGIPDATASSPGHPGYFSQSDIDAEVARPDSFSATVSSVWNATFDSIVSTVTVTCATAWTGGSTVYLRVALAETNDFAISPGSNGEVHFEHVVQAMYPNALGTLLPGTWAAGDTHTYTITGAVPSFVDKAGSPNIVIWMQNDATQEIQVAAQTVPLTISLDAALTSSPATFCVSGASGSVAPVVTLKNTATTVLTSATIYYKIDGGTLMSQAWSGSLAAGSTTNVTLTAATITTGAHTLYDSVAMPNGVADINPVNNASSTAILVQSTTSNPLPLATGFEGSLPANWAFFDANGNGENWAIASATNHISGGTKAAKHDNYDYPSGEVNYCILPTPTIAGTTTLDFWVAYAQYSTENDQLEVVYSTDCGTTWTSVYSKEGTALSTAAATTSAFSPTAAQWRGETVDLSSVPTGSMIAFRATSNFGNNLFIDDVNMHAGASTLGVQQVANSSTAISVYPNPAKDEATLSFSLQAQSNVQIQIVDGLGRTLNTIANETMNEGAHSVVINTSDLASGVYNVMIHTAEGTYTHRLSVVK